MYHILIVDNDFLMREAIITVIKQVKGFNVVEQCTSGTEAVQYCKTNDVDIIFMEVMMPGVTGIDAAKKIYEINRDITVYLMSAYTSFSFARQVLKINVRDYISKPVSMRAVTDLLENYKIEKRGNNQVLLQQLQEITDSCNFSRVFCELEDCAAKILKECDGEKERVQSVLSYIGHNLIGGYCDFENPTIVRELVYPFYNNDTPTRTCIETWLTRLMIDVFNQNANRNYPVMEHVIRYINMHYWETIGLEDIINNCNISQGYLSRIFRKQYSVSVMEYLHMRKLIVAKFYLHFNTYTAIDIAYILGYNESGYFSKVFKKYEGITVQEYRKLCQNSGEVFSGNCEKYLENMELCKLA